MYRNSIKHKIIFGIIIIIINFNFFGQEKKSKVFDEFNINLGLTAFKDPFYNNVLNNDFPLVSKAGLLGLEFVNKKHQLSIEYRKVYWISLSPSNYQSPVSATGNYDYVSLSKYFKVTPKNKLQLAIGYAFIRENGFRNVAYQSTANPRQPIQPTYIQFRAQSNSYTSEAINLSIGINLTRQFFTELRCNYYTKVMHPFFNTGVSASTIQLSFFYKFMSGKDHK